MRLRLSVVRPDGHFGVIVNRRYLHFTPPRLATEVPKDPLADPSVQAFYEKVRNHQGAIDAMMAMRKVMEEKGLSDTCWRCKSSFLTENIGYDVTKPPSTMQMAKMSFDKELRNSASKVGDLQSSYIHLIHFFHQLLTELKAAGVELNADVSHIIWAKRDEAEWLLRLSRSSLAGWYPRASSYHLFFIDDQKIPCILISSAMKFGRRTQSTYSNEYNLMRPRLSSFCQLHRFPLVANRKPSRAASSC